MCNRINELPLCELPIKKRILKNVPLRPCELHKITPRDTSHNQKSREFNNLFLNSTFFVVESFESQEDKTFKIEEHTIKILNTTELKPPFIVGINNYRLLVLNQDTAQINCLIIPKKINGLKLPSDFLNNTLLDYQATCSQTISNFLLISNLSIEEATDYYLDIWSLFCDCPDDKMPYTLQQKVSELNFNSLIMAMLILDILESSQETHSLDWKSIIKKQYLHFLENESNDFKFDFIKKLLASQLYSTFLDSSLSILNNLVRIDDLSYNNKFLSWINVLSIEQKRPILEKILYTEEGLLIIKCLAHARDKTTKYTKKI